MRFPYDEENYEPPAPVAIVTLQSPDATKSIEKVRLLIDTGADVTLLPKWAIASLSIEGTEEPSYELVGFDGSSSVAPSVRIALIWHGKTFRGQFLVVDQTHGILGRNILNNLRIALHGPENSGEIL